ncbi:MAG: putative DNA binding domain-containing protein [Anaerolineae bacterium]|nr:putative DNA binding domain-containing protein [Anaerolineae bacterium]
MNLEELLARPEGKTLEFKRDLSSLKPILKSLVAFANTAGGTLVIGLADDGAIVGLTNVLAEEERLTNAIADGIRPAMTPEIDIVSHAGRALLLVHVPHWHGPFYLRSEGPESGVYVRLGSTNRQAGPEILAEMQRSIAGLSFDQLPYPDLSPGDLDPARLRRFFEQSGREENDEHLESLGVLISHAGRLVPSHGGLILFAPMWCASGSFPMRLSVVPGFVGQTRSSSSTASTWATGRCWRPWTT